MAAKRKVKTASGELTIFQLITKVNRTDASRKTAQFPVIHYVGATGGAEANCKFFFDTYRGASAHYFVGHEGEIWQCVEDEDIAWHCGAKSYKHAKCRNSNSIGIELCVKKDKNGKWYYTKKTIASAVILTAYIMHLYGMKTEDLLRHYDVTGKECGEPHVRNNGKTWKTFVKEVEAELAKYNKKTKEDSKTGNDNKAETKTDAAKKEEKTETKNEPEKEDKSSVPYTIVTTTASLNIRKTPNGVIVGHINEKDVKNKYTIVEEKDGWGRLKSGKGWIFLEYTRKA